MTDAEKYVKVFQAAAEGVLRPFQPSVMPGSAGHFFLDSAGYDYARSMAGAFSAIAEVFQGIVNVEKDRG